MPQYTIQWLRVRSSNEKIHVLFVNQGLGKKSRILSARVILQLRIQQNKIPTTKRKF